MTLCVLILKEEDLLDELLHDFSKQDIHNITVLSSVCMVDEYVNKHKNRDVRIFGSLRHLVDYFSDDSRTIMILCEYEKIKIISENIGKIVPENQYTFFTIPVNNLQGKVE